MSKKKFDIGEFLKNNNFEFDASKHQKQPSREKRTYKSGYNDVRKTLISEAKVKDGKFNLRESLKGQNDDAEMSTETKRRFLEMISTYNTYQSQMERQSDIVEVSETLSEIVSSAKTLTLNETEDWFDKVTVKRNMKQLEDLQKNFDKVTREAKSLDTQMQALYEDMGHILNRYYEVADISEDVMKDRLDRNKTSKKVESKKKKKDSKNESKSSFKNIILGND